VAPVRAIRRRRRTSCCTCQGRCLRKPSPLNPFKCNCDGGLAPPSRNCLQVNAALGEHDPFRRPRLVTPRAIWLLLAAAALIGCRTERRTGVHSPAYPLALAPTPCTSVGVDTAGWQEVRSRWGSFSIRLPPPAGEDSVRCIDSDCGRLRAGRWKIGYDMGHFAGPGTHVELGDGVQLAGACEEIINGRTAHLATGRDVGEHPASGARQFRAVVAFEPAVGSSQLYLSIAAPDSGAVREFLAAVRTVRFHTPPRAGETPERPPN